VKARGKREEESGKGAKPGACHETSKLRYHVHGFAWPCERRLASVVAFSLGLLAALASSHTSSRAAETLDYSVADPAVRLERLDSSPKESFLSMRVDSAGRLFVGGREALFVYEPAGEGKFAPRRELLQFPPHSWIYDIEIHGNDLYLLTLSALYVVPDGVVKRHDLQPKKLLWGVPRYHVHQCFHALAWGPEGDLYISMGDTLVHYGDFERPDHWGHWTFFTLAAKNGIPYTGQGAVLRMHPDGSGLQVVARGFRNCCGLVFDKNWNLFGNDNDHESLPLAYVPGRLLHVTRHSDFAWPRGWMPHITPDRADLLETMFTGMGRAVPVGQAYLDSPHIPAKFRNNLLVARWGIRALMRYPISPRGASFSATEIPLLVGKNQARPVGVTVDPDGRIYVAIAYMAHNDGSPIYASDLVRLTFDGTRSSPPPREEIGNRSPSALYADMSNSSWEIRRLAQVELLRRGGEALQPAIALLASTKLDDPAILELIWLAAATRTTTARDTLIKLAQDADDTVRLQAVRALHEFFASDPDAVQLFSAKLTDKNPQVVLAAIDAFFDASPAPFDPIAKLGGSADSYLRQAATMLLAERAPLEFLKSISAAADDKTRLAGVLATGFRLTMPPANRTLDPSLPLSPWTEEAIYKVRYFHETVDLRMRGRLGMFTVAEHWKAGRHTAEQESLFALLRERLADSSDRVRLQAAHFLYLLDDPRTELLIRELRKTTERARLAGAPLKSLGRAWGIGPFADGPGGLATVHPLERGPLDPSATYPSGTKTLGWQVVQNDHLFDFRKTFGLSTNASYYAYCRIETPTAQQMMLLPGSDAGLKIWQNGRAIWTHEGSRGALPLEDVVFLDLQPGGNDLLFRVNNLDGACGLYVHYRTLTPVTSTLPEKIGNAAFRDRLKSAGKGATPIGPEFLSVNWPTVVSHGDTERGRKLFGVDGIGCAKCHAIDNHSAAVGGPSLAGAAARFTVPYLVESVLAPSRTVSPVFRSTLLVLRDGQTMTGLVLGETSGKIELLLPNATRKTIPAAEVEERKLENLSPMPAGLVKTPDELRDLLAYLLSATK
jgi:putative heme-binding domain-containing protein